MKLTDIKCIRTYQAVQFEGKMNSFYSTEKVHNRPPATLQIVESVGVCITSEKDCVLVPFTNISGVYMKTEHYKSEKARKEKEILEIEKSKTSVKVSKIKKDPIGAKRL